jgi:MoaA/NifB/PqqE/SkfB family radical SAM enzyme
LYVQLWELGVPHLTFTGSEATLRFDLPVPYSASNPVALETQEDHIPEGAGKAWLYVEPDGDLLPAQGMADRVLGNLLRDNWRDIFPAS